jgi:hypothetical protein
MVEQNGHKYLYVVLIPFYFSGNYGHFVKQGALLWGTALFIRPNFELLADLLHVLSYIPKDLNFIQHTSYIGWRE